MIHAQTWMNPKCVMRTERSQLQKACDSTYMTLWEKQKYRQKTDQWLPGAEVGDRLGILWDTGIVLYPTCGGGGYKNLYMC